MEHFNTICIEYSIQAGLYQPLRITVPCYSFSEDVTTRGLYTWNNIWSLPIGESMSVDSTFVHWRHRRSCGIIHRSLEGAVRLRALRIPLLPVFSGRQRAILREANGAGCTELESALRLSPPCQGHMHVICTRQSVTPVGEGL